MFSRVSAHHVVRSEDISMDDLFSPRSAYGRSSYIGKTRPGFIPYRFFSSTRPSFFSGQWLTSLARPSRIGVASCNMLAFLYANVYP